MPKRRHEEVSEDLDETLPTEAAPKKTRFAAEVANEYGENGVPNKTEYWVVRKPKNVSLFCYIIFVLGKSEFKTDE